MFEAHFQSFEDRTEHGASGPRVAALRTELARRGLTGSAGVAIVLMERAVLFVDGRYTLQAREQVDTSLFAIEHLIDMPPNRWIEENLTADDRLGYDPWLHTVEAT